MTSKVLKKRKKKVFQKKAEGYPYKLTPPFQFVRATVVFSYHFLLNPLSLWQYTHKKSVSLEEQVGLNLALFQKSSLFFVSSSFPFLWGALVSHWMSACAGENPLLSPVPQVAWIPRNFQGQVTALKSAILTAKLNHNSLFYFLFKKKSQRRCFQGGAFAANFYLTQADRQAAERGNRKISLQQRQTWRRIDDEEKQWNQRWQPALSLLPKSFHNTGDKEKCLQGTS